MKKVYQQPQMRTERFDPEDVITASANNGTLPLLGNAFEQPLDNTAGLFSAH